METIDNQVCPGCGNLNLSIYFSDKTDDKLGVWCESCNWKAYYCGDAQILIDHS